VLPHVVDTLLLTSAPVLVVWSGMYHRLASLCRYAGIRHAVCNPGSKTAVARRLQAAQRASGRRDPL